jgi:hypothetical protein
MLEKDQVKLDLSLVSSIMNFAGYKGLLGYLSVETYKQVEKDEYLDFHKISQFSFEETKENWEEIMDKLVEMKLATKNGQKYITRRKLKDWKVFSSENTNFSNKFNGYIIFNMTELYKCKNNKENLKDLLYLSIHENVIRGKSISRNFIKDLTGIGKNYQKTIEKKYEGTLVEVVDHHIPLNDKEQKLSNKPVFNGVISPKHLFCTKTSKKKSNCKVIQLGNKVKIKKLNLSTFKSKKVKSKIIKSKFLNESFTNNEVQDWENFDMVIDTSKESKSNKFKGVLSVNDKRSISWKDFYHYDYENVAVITGNGTFSDIRSSLNQ